MGKNKYIETPKKMWELFEGYKRETKATPFLVHDYVGKDGISVYREKERCLTMEGFEEYVVDHSKITYPDLTEYFEGKNPSYKDYFPICLRIARNIRKDQIEGGMAGIYNASLTQRINSLTEKTETKTEGDIIISFKD